MFSAAVVMTLLSANAQKRAFTIEDLYRVKGVSSVSLSPDGKTVCYTASSSDLKNQKSGSDIYIMNADGSHAKALTEDGKSSSALVTIKALSAGAAAVSKPEPIPAGESIRTKSKLSFTELTS